MNRSKLEKLVSLYPALTLYYDISVGWFVYLARTPSRRIYLGTMGEMHLKDIAEKCHELDPKGPSPGYVKTVLYKA